MSGIYLSVYEKNLTQNCCIYFLLFLKYNFNRIEIKFNTCTLFETLWYIGIGKPVISKENFQTL